jgi:hypothetical protein
MKPVISALQIHTSLTAQRIMNCHSLGCLTSVSLKMSCWRTLLSQYHPSSVDDLSGLRQFIPDTVSKMHLTRKPPFDSGA